MTYLQRRIFTPLGMRPVNIDDSNGTPFPARHHRNAHGPVRTARPPARGWLLAAGELSRTAAGLAKWNVARINRTLLPADDWAEQEAPGHVADGSTNGYGLGVSSGTANGRRFLNHGRESVGFVSQNTVFPDQRAAVVALTNADFGHVTDVLTSGLADIILPAPSPPAPAVNEPDRAADARALYDALVAGRLEPRLLTANLRDYFDATRLGDYRSSLARLGRATSFVATGPARLRGGFVSRRFRVVAGGRTLNVNSYAEPGRVPLGTVHRLPTIMDYSR